MQGFPVMLIQPYKTYGTLYSSHLNTIQCLYWQVTVEMIVKIWKTKYLSFKTNKYIFNRLYRYINKLSIFKIRKNGNILKNEIELRIVKFKRILILNRIPHQNL